MKQVKDLEKNRIYCHHELEHALDVARMAWIAFLENRISGQTLVDYAEEKILRQQSTDYDEMAGKSINYRDDLTGKSCSLEQIKDLIYVCALLHDIGRAAQYETGVHHSVSGLSLAGQIMDECEVPWVWKQEILNVISDHHQSIREKDEEKDSVKNTEKIDYRSDQNKCKGVKNNNLAYYIRKADHDCRLCFLCEAKDTCKWKEQERNYAVTS